MTEDNKILFYISEISKYCGEQGCNTCVLYKTLDNTGKSICECFEDCPKYFCNEFNIENIPQIKTYEDGLSKVWDFLKEASTWNSKEEADDFNEFMKINRTSEIFDKYSPEEAIEKFQEWKEEKGIKVGDIVKHDVTGLLAVVTSILEDYHGTKKYTLL